MVRNILFIDSNAILSNAIEKSLAKYSERFSVLIACDGFEAVKLLKKTPVSLIVTELVMPRMDGMSLINHLRENYSDIPAIIISSMDDTRLQEIAKESGIVGYLKKPFQTKKLVAAINSVLQKEAAGGIMHDISPTVFFQLMEMDAKSCTIRIIDNKTHQGGILYFKDGELLDARIGNLHGIKAAYELFSWDSATIFMRNECDPREDNIKSALTPIIMKAVGMKDEAEDHQPDDSTDPARRDILNKEKTSSSSSSNSARIELLKKELGRELGLKECFQDAQVTEVVEQLTEHGNKSSFGKFKFAYLDYVGRNKIVLSGQPPEVLDVEPTCSSDKITNLLKDCRNPDSS